MSCLTEASTANDALSPTRAVPNGRCTTSSKAATRLSTERWQTITPFGRPVEPEV